MNPTPRALDLDRGPEEVGIFRPAAYLLFLLALAAALACGVRKPPAEAQDYRALLGIEVESLRLSASDMVVDMRYRVLDAAKAQAVHKKGLTISLIDEATHSVLKVPSPAYVGPLRQRSDRIQEGKVYFMLFANGGRVVKSGNRVTLVLGDVRIPGLTVE
ncbi:MAG: hypothetical protein ACOYXN_06690 [Acidobacteriota bacterium]